MPLCNLRGQQRGKRIIIYRATNTVRRQTRAIREGVRGILVTKASPPQCTDSDRLIGLYGRRQSLGKSGIEQL